VRESLSLTLVAGEELNVKGMTSSAAKGKRKRQKAGLNRSILEVGFATIGQLLGYKLAEAGGFYLESPTRKLKPTQRCVKCWELTPKTLADRMHVCSNPDCCHTEDRDVNAAQVNLTWARGQELAFRLTLSRQALPHAEVCGNLGRRSVGNLNLLLGIWKPQPRNAGWGSSSTHLDSFPHFLQLVPLVSKVL